MPNIKSPWSNKQDDTESVSTVPYYPNQTLKWQLHFDIPPLTWWESAQVCCLLRAPQIGAVLRICSTACCGPDAQGGLSGVCAAWGQPGENCLQNGFVSFWYCYNPKLGLWCRAFSNYIYSFSLSSPSPCEQRGAQWPLPKNTSTSKILMSSLNLQDSWVSEELLGAILRAVWWYHPWLRPAIDERATSQCQALLCSFSYWDNSELWGTVTFPTMQWTGFSLSWEMTGELFSSCCSPLTQRIPGARLSYE